MENFWQQLKKPVFALAPMEAVTDFVFREIFARHGKPDVMFTEFVSTEGLSHPEGRKKLVLDLKYSERQRPVVAQIWGRDPKKFFESAKLVKELGFNGVDINMGCPQDKEIAQQTCAYLIREPALAAEIVYATMEGAAGIPVSVKTRIGYEKPDVEKWIGCLLKTQPAAITVHGRTKKEKSKVPAHWDEIKKAVELRNSLNSHTLILGNGDINTRKDALEKVSLTGVDGVMVARGAFGNPWIFLENFYEPTVKERLTVMLEHAFLFESEYPGTKPFVQMRKNFKGYCSGFAGAAELRVRLMEAASGAEAQKIVEDFLVQAKL